MTWNTGHAYQSILVKCAQGPAALQMATKGHQIIEKGPTGEQCKIIRKTTLVLDENFHSLSRRADGDYFTAEIRS